MSPRFTRPWNSRCRRCWRAWKSAAFRSTRPCWRASRRTSARSRPRSSRRSTRSPARRSIPAARSSWATSCSDRWACRAAPRRKTGQWSTGARALEELAEQGHKLPQVILDWRQVSKLRSTYTEALPTYVNPKTKRVHTSYALAATSTGRLSSSEPNLQNIPIRTEEGRKIRKAFVATPGHKLVSADYSQIELRLARRSRRRAGPAQGLPGRHRHSRDDGLGNVRRAGQGHAGRSAPPRQGDQFRHHLRHLGLRARQPARIPREEAGAYIKKYFERFPGIRDYMDESKEFCRKHGYVLTLVRAQMPLSRTSGRRMRRYAPSMSAPPSMRGCKEAPPTSSAAPWCGWSRR